MVGKLITCLNELGRSTCTFYDNNISQIVLDFISPDDKVIEAVEVLCMTHKPKIEKVKGISQWYIEKVAKLGYALHPTITRKVYWEWCVDLDYRVYDNDAYVFLKPLDIGQPMGHPPTNRGHFIELQDYYSLEQQMPEDLRVMIEQDEKVKQMEKVSQRLLRNVNNKHKQKLLRQQLKAKRK